jgi:peptidoglycan/LPS O-acetylase OafA/YrhL
VNRSRNSFDFLRLLAAAFVLFSHGLGLWDRRNDPFADFTGLTTLGTIGVAMFFAVSGYWVTASWQNAGSLKVFAANRGLRLFPALVLCVLVTVFALGPAMTALPLADYFSSRETWSYLTNAFLRLKWTLPGVFASNPYPLSVNGSLWTLPIEALAYCCVAAIGVARLVDWRATLAVTAAFLLLLLALSLQAWRPTLVVPLWSSVAVVESARLMVPFFIGVTVRLAGDRALSWWLCGAWIVAMWLVARTEAAAVVAMAGAGYIALVVGIRPIPVLHGFGRYGDFSYGMYLYAWPVSQTLVTFMDRDGGVFRFLLACFVVTLGCAVLSWFAVEKPCLALKRRSLVDGNRPRA